MHGLVFKTSIWLLAGSTRLLSFLFFDYQLLKSFRLERSVKFLKGSIVVMISKNHYWKLHIASLNEFKNAIVRFFYYLTTN